MSRDGLVLLLGVEVFPQFDDNPGLIGDDELTLQLLELSSDGASGFHPSLGSEVFKLGRIYGDLGVGILFYFKIKKNDFISYFVRIY